jgi:hypothetical protein
MKTLTTSRDPYRLVHDRKRAACGPAANHQCVDCPHQAAEWSLNPNPQGELHIARHGARAKWFSDDPADYSPRCRPCHRRMDRALRKAAAA